MRIFFLFTWLTGIFSCLDKPQDNECRRFQTGKFFYYRQDRKLKYTVDRGSSLQIESDSTGHVNIFKIKWTNACKYELQLKYSNRPQPPDAVYIYRDPLNEEIVFVGKNYYVFKLTKKIAPDLNYKDTIWVLK